MKTVHLAIISMRNFPGSPVLTTPCFIARGLQSLVGELRSYKLHRMAKIMIIIIIANYKT